VARPPLVGRRRELAQLSLLRDAALEERHPQLISVVAPAGTGKTRLLEEFLAGLDPAQGWRVATARCLPYGQSLTYWPLRGLLDELLDEPFSPALVRAAYSAGGQTEDDAARLTGLLLASLGAEASGATSQPVERASAFAAWRLLVEAVARQAPRIVVFEDLHWASDSLLDLVEHVTHPRTSAALLILVLSRPELLDRRPAWGGGLPSFTALTLRPLDTIQSRALVDELVSAPVAEAARQRIVERSGGNPFFAIELSRGLAERPGEGTGDHASHARDTTESGALPETVHEAVLARLDQLPGAERQVLQVAAVAGRTFRVHTLRAALPERDPAAIAGALEGLLARDVLVEVENSVGEGEGAYTFRHILFRDVAYNTLARAERVRLHLAVARWLEDYAADRLDEFIELLAYHYREAATLAAQAVAPLGVEVDTARAARYLARAGERASHVGLAGPAIAHLRAALALAPAEDQPRLFEQLGDCAVVGDTTIEGYQRALDLWRADGAGGSPDPRTGARLLRKLLSAHEFWAGSFSVMPSPEELAALRAEALDLAAAAGDEDEQWRILIAVNPFVDPGGLAQRERDRAVCEAAAAYFERRGDWRGLYGALDNYAAAALMLGDREATIAASRRCLEWPDSPAWASGNAHATIVKAHFGACDFAACLIEALEARAGTRPGDPLWPLAETVEVAAAAAYVSGRWSELDELRQTLELILDEAQSTQGVASAQNAWVGYLPVLLVALAREDRAAAEAAAGLLERMVVQGNPVSAYRQSLVAAILADDPARFDFAYYGLGRGGMSGWAISWLAERGSAAPPGILQRQRESASGFDTANIEVSILEAVNANDNDQFAAAVEAAEAHHMVTLAARARVALALRTGDRAHLERARPVLERLGDRQFLRRLEEAQDAIN
jgi:hypothetical protein